MTKQQDLLSVTAFFSALFHAVIILGVSFKLPELADLQNTDNMLDVVLVNAPNSQKVEDAELVSTRDSEGGGPDDKSASAPIPFKETNPSQVDSIKRVASEQAATRLSPDQMLTANQGNVALSKEAPQESVLKSENRTPGPDKITTRSQRELERERLIAKLSEQWEDYQKRPVKEYLSPSTRKHEAAQYLDNWRRKVEQVGNANYPQQARSQRLAGTLILTVEINRNGTINSIQVNTPASHKVLNDSAIRFVRDASPFGAFPDEIDKNTDILVITRAFHFLTNNRLASSDASGQR